MAFLSLLSIRYTQACFDLYSSLQFLMREIFIAYLFEIFTFSMSFHSEKYLSMNFDIILIDN